MSGPRHTAHGLIVFSLPYPKRQFAPPLLGTASASPQASRSITPSREEPSRDAFARVAREIHFGQFLMTFSATITLRKLR